MEVKWTKLAATDLKQIKNFIYKENLQAAKEVAFKIIGAAETLAELPSKGRHGRVSKTRELVMTDLPYIIIYRVREQAIQILRVIHTSKQWP